ncbi:CBS domain-containing protein [Halochromatium salexigens]|uniref:CBS domain-containing protein n=1 Tax=Halochromatium salexigens TaxID=49447 RepID=A0AAJ0UC97_HALSE|nr:CBS domain-containing protein [Halochromatium salexigens]MBK5928984.1 hypothetical protein [Halochromatium salexigens]
MTTGVELRYTDDDVDKAATLMEQQQIRRLIVVDRTERSVGVVSLGNLATRADQAQLSGEALRSLPAATLAQPGRVARRWDNSLSNNEARRCNAGSRDWACTFENQAR